MMKLFRKYNREILAGLVVFLMIVFLGGDALQRMMTPNRNVLVAESKVGPIHQSDQDRAQHVTRILQAFQLPWDRPAPGANEPLTSTDWILLTRESERLGLRPDEGGAIVWMGEAASAENIERFARNLRVRPAEIIDAIRDFRGVQLAAMAVATAAAPSAAEVRSVAAAELDKVKIRAVLVPGQHFVDATHEFSDEQIETQFQAYKDTRKGDGLNFGYLLPPAVKIQYIKIDRDKIAEKIGVPNLESKAKEYYDQNRDRVFKRPPPPPPAEGEQPKEQKPYFEWDDPEAKKIAFDLIRKRAADEAAARISDWLIPNMSEPWLNQPAGEDGYKTAPAEVADLGYFEERVKRVPTNIAFPEAMSVSVSEFFSEDKSRQVPYIGEANYRPERGPMESIKSLAFRNRVLVPQIPKAAGIDPTAFLAMYQPSKFPLTDQHGSVYIFRVLEAKPERAAESVAEVRDRVIEDLRLKFGYQTAHAYTEQLVMDALAAGDLKTTYDNNADLAVLKEKEGSGFSTPEAFSRLHSGLGVFGRTSPTTFIPGGPGRVPNEVVDQIFAMENSEEKIRLFEVPARACVLAVEFIGVARGREDEFEGIRQRISQGLSDQRQASAVRDWLNPENVRARNVLEMAGAKRQ